MNQLPDFFIEPLKAESPPQALYRSGSALASGWLNVPAVYRPTLAYFGSSSQPLAAALLTSRPSTATRKIAEVEVLSDEPELAFEALEGLIKGIIEWARTEGAVSVKWQTSGEDQRRLAAQLGFTQLPAPLLSGAGTEVFVEDGYVRWFHPWPHEELPYYRQTTEFTCGPVALLIAEGGPAEKITREEERRRWHLATSFPGSSPVGLATTIDLNRFSAEVYLDAPGAVLLEFVEHPVLRVAKEYLDEEHRQVAVGLGIPVHQEYLETGRILAHVRDGGRAVLLINELRLHEQAGPHWITLHSVRGNHVLVHDPWVDGLGTETWIDGHDLALTVEDLDAIIEWGEPSYRGVILLSPKRSDPSGETE